MSGAGGRIGRLFSGTLDLPTRGRIAEIPELKGTNQELQHICGSTSRVVKENAPDDRAPIRDEPIRRAARICRVPFAR